MFLLEILCKKALKAIFIRHHSIALWYIFESSFVSSNL